MAQVSDYLGLITSEHRDKPNYTAFLTAILSPLVTNLNVALSLPDLFFIDTATGVQLDAVGAWVGASRYIPIETQNVSFTWDSGVPLGWENGYWGASVINIASYLPDPVYRTYIYARIANNGFKGSLLQAYQVLNKVYGSPGTTIQLADGQNMTVNLNIIGTINPLIKLLAQLGYLQVKPMGVNLIISYP